MAVTLTKVAATPYCLKYTWLGTGTDIGAKTAAQLIADCAAGPLKQLLTQVNAGLNAGVTGLTWATLAHSALLSVYLMLEATSGTTTNEISSAFTSGPNTFSINIAVGANTENGYIEIRYFPSSIQ
jgi:hypothetical protein